MLAKNKLITSKSFHSIFVASQSVHLQQYYEALAFRYCSVVVAAASDFLWPQSELKVQVCDATKVQ